MGGLAQAGFDIAAVHCNHRGGGFGSGCQIDEGVGDIFRRHFPLEQVARHIVGFRHAARLGAGRHHFVGQQAAADAVGIDRIGADAVLAMVQGILLDQEQGRRLGQAIRPEILARIDRLLGGVEQQAAEGAWACMMRVACCATA